MTFYSDIPARRARQLAGDIWLVLWSVLWVWAALRLYDLVMNLAAPGVAIAEGVGELATNLDAARDSVVGVPLVGEALAAPFSGMGAAAASIAAAGQAEADAVALLARFLSISLAVLAIASFAVIWVPIRISFVRKATAYWKWASALSGETFTACFP